MKPVTFTLHPLSTVAGACLLGAVLFFSSAAFGLGVSDKLIDTIDSDGVALAAVQGLHALVRERDADCRPPPVAQPPLRLRAAHPRGCGR